MRARNRFGAWVGAWVGVPAACAVGWSALVCSAGCESTPKRDAAQEAADQMVLNSQEGLRLAKEAQRQAERGDKDGAIQTYQRAVSTWRGMPAAWNNLGVLLMEKQDYAGAVGAFKVAAELSPTDPRPLENIAVSYVKSGWATDALRYYGMALERDPNRIESLRGAVRTAEMVRIRDDATLDRIRRALLIESDASYREYFERQQQLVSAALAGQMP